MAFIEEKMFSDETLNAWVEIAKKSPVFTHADEGSLKSLVRVFANQIDEFFLQALNGFENEEYYDIYYHTYKGLIDYELNYLGLFIEQFEMFHKDLEGTADMHKATLTDFCETVFSMVPVMAFNFYHDTNGNGIVPMEVSEEVLTRFISAGRLSMPFNFEEYEEELDHLGERGQVLLFMLSLIHKLRMDPDLRNHQSTLDDLVSGIFMLSNLTFTDVSTTFGLTEDMDAIAANVRIPCWGYTDTAK